MSTGLSLKLDPVEWDISLDEFGNLAMVTGDMAICQDVCTALRVFKNDLYYSPEKGIDYKQLAFTPSPAGRQILKSEIMAAARAVPGVKELALAELAAGADRILTSAMYIRTVNNNDYAVNTQEKIDADI